MVYIYEIYHMLLYTIYNLYEFINVLELIHYFILSELQT